MHGDAARGRQIAAARAALRVALDDGRNNAAQKAPAAQSDYLLHGSIGALAAFAAKTRPAPMVRSLGTFALSRNGVQYRFFRFRAFARGL
jgi:hypothetical protein